MRLTANRSAVSNITAISSKSYVHRLIIAASLYARGKVTIVSNIMSADMEATVRAVNALGGKVSVSAVSDGYEISIDRPLGAKIMEIASVDCGESGSTARFILPFASMFAKEATLTGSGRLPERPMGPLCDVLRNAGVAVSADHLPITVSGRPVPGRYEIAGNVSSQYISGLLFMLPLLDGDCELTVTGAFESAAYVDMTVEVLRRFGVGIKCQKGRFVVTHFRDSAGRKNGAGSSDDDGRPEIRIVAEGDWSNAAYVMAIASLGSGRAFDRLAIDGLNPDSIQGDRAVVDIMRAFGIEVDKECADDKKIARFTVKGSPAKPVDIDCSQIPDLVPALAVLAAYAEGDSTFRNVGRLRMKECDRIDAVQSLLAAVDVVVDITTDGNAENMTVHGKGNTKKAGREITVDSFNDHRIAMAATALAFAETVPVVIEDPMAVNKSYPGFFDEMKKLGIVTEE